MFCTTYILSPERGTCRWGNLPITWSSALDVRLNGAIVSHLRSEMMKCNINEPHRDKTNKMACARSEGSDDFVMRWPKYKWHVTMFKVS